MNPLTKFFIERKMYACIETSIERIFYTEYVSLIKRSVFKACEQFVNYKVSKGSDLSNGISISFPKINL